MAGALPEADELEVSLFGPGYGEAIAMHVGDGQWMLVDSCWLDRGRGIAVTAKYLDDLGVADDQVRHVVASHWHDDHVGGLASLVRRYKGAEFHFPSFLSEQEGVDFLSAYSGRANPDADGTTELYAAMAEVRDSGRLFSPLHFRTIVAEQRFSFGSMRGRRDVTEWQCMGGCHGISAITSESSYCSEESATPGDKSILCRCAR